MNSSQAGRWRFLTAVHSFNALSGLLGGGALAIWTDGSLLHADLAMLRGTPFTDFVVPGLLLFGCVGVTNMVAAMLAFHREEGAESIPFLAGLATLGWIIGELIVLRTFSPLQAVYAVTGILLMLDAGWIRSSARRLAHA